MDGENTLGRDPDHARPQGHRLLPEEDAIGDPDDEDDGQDETLPADLWYQSSFLGYVARTP